MPTNNALWLLAKRGVPIIAEAPFPSAGALQIVVRVAAVSINPIDWILQSVGSLIFPWLRYPLVLGWDVAGEVVATGSEVTRFKIGDRVFGLAVGQDKSVNDSAEGAFQTFAILREHLASPLPPTLSFEQGATLPLALSTAACGLFQSDGLALAPPQEAPAPTGRTVLVWGGSTSVGSNAIQLAVAAGYEVITTASPRNHDYVKRLGATEAFDYRSPSVVKDIVRALGGRTLAGALAVGAGSAKPCVEIVAVCDGEKRVAMASPPVSFEDAPATGGRTLWFMRKLTRMVVGTLSVMLSARRHGIVSTFINGSTLLGDSVGPMIYADFLPRALASGRYRVAPEPLVVGRGLDAIPAALDHQRKGVSAQKIVVTL